MVDFYKTCEDKQLGLNSLSWEEISQLYNYKSGEAARCKWKKIRKNNGLINNTITKNILVISDLHIPFQLDNLFDIFKQYQNKIDTLLFNGDEQDCQSISKFRKKYRIPFIDELIQTRQFILESVNIIKPKRVVLNFGNHNKRLISYLSDKINEDLLEIMPDTNLELIIENGFYQKDRINGTKTYYEPLNKVIKNIEYTHNWYNQIDDVIFCHPSAFKSGILKTAQDAWLYFLQKGYRFKCLVCSHTHASGLFKYGEGFIVETGALCKELDYVKEGRLGRPQSNGFFYCVLENDKFSYEKSKLIIL